MVNISEVEFVRGYSTTTSITIALFNMDEEQVVESSIAPNINFQISLYLSDVDMAITTAEVIDDVFVSFEASDLSRGLPALESMEIQGTAEVHIPRALCTDIQYLCVNVTSATSATYITPAEQRMTECVNISQFKNCEGQQQTIMTYCKDMVCW